MSRHFLEILLYISLYFTGISLCLRLCLIKKYPKILGLQSRIFGYFVKKPWCYSSLKFCHRLTKNLFLGDPYWFRLGLIWCSGLLVGFGIPFRLFVTQGFFFPGQHWVLFLLGVNSIFRGMINLGMLLSGSNMWKQLVEKVFQNGSRNASNFSRTATSSFHTHQSNFTPNENSQDSKNDQKQDSKYHSSANSWTNAIGAATIIGAVGTVYNCFDIWERRSRDPATPQRVKELEKEKADWQKEKADWQKKNTNLETQIDRLQESNKAARELEDKIDELRKNN